jgi:NAD(P)-dependent dehydrogenase (short-subunit alcohol dehydrogenase family)
MTEKSTNPFSLEGQLGLITGGGTGIGFGIAQAYVAQGARVVITGRREELLVEAVAQLGPMADYRVHDVTQYDTTESLIESIEAQYGSLTSLVNNAGNQIRRAAEDFMEEEMQQVLDVHLVGAFSMSRHAARRMMERGYGNILYIASMASLFGIPYVSAYAAAKTAHLGLVRTLATEWSGRGVRINAIAPGWIVTEMSRTAFEKNPERKAKVLGRTPMQQLGEPEDIGWTAAFLASPAAKFITGTCIPVDGGASIGF